MKSKLGYTGILKLVMKNKYIFGRTLVKFGREICNSIQLAYVEFLWLYYHFKLVVGIKVNFGTGLCITGRVNYGPTHVKFGREIYNPIQLTYVEFHGYTDIFMLDMKIKVIFEREPYMTSIVNYGSTLEKIGGEIFNPTQLTYVEFHGYIGIFMLVLMIKVIFGREPSMTSGVNYEPTLVKFGGAISNAN